MQQIKDITVIPPDPKYDTHIRIEHKTLKVAGSVQDLSSRKTAMKLK